MSGAAHRILVIGVGNPDRGDDGVGCVVAHRLKSGTTPLARVIEVNGEVTELLDLLSGSSDVLIIDACQSGVAPGTIQRIDVADRMLPSDSFGASTHGMGLAQAIELARSFDQLPQRCIVFAVEGDSFEIGAPLSPAVQESVPIVVQRLWEEIAAIAREGAIIDA